MRKTIKPVRKCYSCLLNLGTHCWAFESPRTEWLKKECRGFENEQMYAEYLEWKKMPAIMTTRQIRQEVFRARRKPIPPRSKRPGSRSQR